MSNRVVSWFQKLLGLEPSVAKITAPIGKIVAKLENYASAQALEAEAHAIEARALTTLAGVKSQAAVEAKALRDLYAKLVSGN